MRCRVVRVMTVGMRSRARRRKCLGCIRRMGKLGAATVPMGREIGGWRGAPEYGVENPEAEWGQYVLIRPFEEERFLASLRKAEATPASELNPGGNRAIIFCSTTKLLKRFVTRIRPAKRSFVPPSGGASAIGRSFPPPESPGSAAGCPTAPPRTRASPIRAPGSSTHGLTR